MGLVIHRPHGGLAVKDRPQRLREFIELGGDFAKERRVVRAQATRCADIPRIPGNLHGQEQRETFPPQGPRLDPIPVARKALIADPAHHRMGDRLGRLMVGLEFGAVVGVTRPLELEAAARCRQCQQRPNLILESVETRKTGSPEIRRLHPEALCGNRAALRKPIENHSVAEDAVRGLGMRFHSTSLPCSAATRVKFPPPSQCSRRSRS